MNAPQGAKLTTDALREPSLPLDFRKEADADQIENELFVDFDIAKSADADDGSVRIEGYINSSNIDDDIDADIVEPKAFEKDLAHFMRHPVIRREHKHPIGRVERIEFRPEGPWFEGVVTHDAPGEQTRDMIRKKVLRGISARFMVDPRRVQTDVELLPKGEGRMRVKRARLVEVTVTDVPRNSSGHFRIKDSTRASFQKSLGVGPSPKPHQEEKRMDFLKLIAQLLRDAGHPCDAENEASVMKSLGDLISKGKGAAALATIAKSLGKSETASADEIIAAINEASKKDGLVSKSLLDEAETKRAALEIDLQLLKFANRITPSNRDFAKSLAEKDIKMFEQWVGTQPEVPATRLPAGAGAGAPPKAAEGLTALDLEVAKSFGVLTDEAKLKEFVAIKPHEITSRLFGQPVSETAHDKAFGQMQSQPWDSVVAE